MDNGQAIDASGNYTDGRPFSGIRELGAMISGDPQFASCMTRKLYTYALGRAPMEVAGHMDPGVLFNAAAAFGKGYQFETLVQNIVASDTFQKRRGEPAVAGGSK
jgi:hypothetical protein